MNKLFCVLIILSCLRLAGCSKTERDIDEYEGGIPENPYTSIPEPDSVYQVPARLLNCNFFDENEFGIYTSQAKVYDMNGKILCGTVPHHLLAGKMIAGFFKTAAENRADIETVVVIAPIHEPLNNKLCVSIADWATPFGVLKNDCDLSRRLINGTGAAIDDDMVEKDHSASSLIPFVKYYFPQASAACFLIAGGADKTIPERVSEILEEFAGEKNCLFVFSVDFSHYLTPGQTRERDNETLEAVMSGNVNLIAGMDNGNMDSPKCVCAFLHLTKRLNGNVLMLDHSNSLEISRLPYTSPDFDEGLTSYFVFAGTGDKFIP